MKMVYIAGPYRDATHYWIHKNTETALAVGGLVLELGGFPVVPHACTHHYDGLKSDTFWLSGTMELMRRCDGVVVCDDWVSSVGTVGEVGEAVRLGVPVFIPPISWAAVRRWICGDWDVTLTNNLVDHARRALGVDPMAIETACCHGEK